MGAVAPSLPLALVRLALVFAAFLLPGAGWASWLARDRRRSNAEPPGLLLCLALGFAISFALFGLLGWPFLWDRRPFAEFLSLLYPAWAIFSLSLLVIRFLPAGKPDAAREAPLDDRLSAHSRCDHRKNAALYAYLVGAIGILYLYAFWPSARGIVLRLLPLVLLLGFFIVRRLRAQISPLLDESALDRSAPPRLWRIAAGLLVALQVVAIAMFSRPDWDDCYYLAAVLDYEQAAQLNAEEPSHRENLPVPTQHRTLCWELFGAVLGRISGISPLVLYHTLLPMGLLLLAYAAYAALLRELLPRRYVPLGILALSALHLWGISSHGAAANFLLPRLGQAKSVLLHVTMPLSIALLLRFAARPDFRLVVLLISTVICALALSLSAIFVTLGLLGIVGLALFLTAQDAPRRIALVGAVGLSSTPLLVAGLLMRAAVGREVGLHARPFGSSEWLETLQSFLGVGAAEILWFLSLPLLSLFVRESRARAYLLLSPLVAALTLLDPLLFHIVAGSLTSYHTYPRLFWLLPVGPGLAVLLALGCRALGRVLDGDKATDRPFGLALALCAISIVLPGIYVFGARNSFIGPLGTPSLARNLEKVPPALLTIAEKLAARAEISRQRILCNEQIASFLSPYSRDFRFVQTRSLYTPVLFAGAGRSDEGIERALLASILRRGRLEKLPQRDEFIELQLLFGEDGVHEGFAKSIARARRDLPLLLKDYQVGYVISGPGDHANLPALLSANGFSRELVDGEFTLWRSSALVTSRQ